MKLRQFGVSALLVALATPWAPCEAQRSSFSKCDVVAEVGVAAAHPGIDRLIDKWANEESITAPRRTRDQLASEYLCVEALLRERWREASAEEFREVGLEVLKVYLDDLTHDEPTSLSVIFSTRLGLSGLGQPRPRPYRKLFIVTSPADAEASLDEESVPEKWCFATVGKHQLEAHRDGYEPCQRKIKIKTGVGPVEERCELKKKAAQKPRPQPKTLPGKSPGGATRGEEAGQESR